MNFNAFRLIDGLITAKGVEFHSRDTHVQEQAPHFIGFLRIRQTDWITSNIFPLALTAEPAVDVIMPCRERAVRTCIGSSTSSTAALRQDHKGAVRYIIRGEEGPRIHRRSSVTAGLPGGLLCATSQDRRMRIRGRYEGTKVHPALSAIVTRISCSIRYCAERHELSSTRARAEPTPCEAHDVADRCVPWIQTNEVGIGSHRLVGTARAARLGYTHGLARVAEAGDRVRRPAHAYGSTLGTVRVPRVLLVLGDDAVDARSSSAAYGRAAWQWRVYATRWQIYWWATERGEIGMRCHGLHRGRTNGELRPPGGGGSCPSKRPGVKVPGKLFRGAARTAATSPVYGTLLAPGVVSGAAGLERCAVVGCGCPHYGIPVRFRNPVIQCWGTSRKPRVPPPSPPHTPSLPLLPLILGFALVLALLSSVPNVLSLRPQFPFLLPPTDASIFLFFRISLDPPASSRPPPSASLPFPSLCRPRLPLRGTRPADFTARSAHGKRSVWLRERRRKWEVGSGGRSGAFAGGTQSVLGSPVVVVYCIGASV
ncbi:hypothetical protein B0H14DRAFT_3163459 [Mycena olivaceomarginata]|nr:hypothetical protein B0H14DRAFT_3163459 [Mycena olivaceomarginata]